MTMHKKDAARLLGLSGTVTAADIKAAYKAAAKKYHPDINPAGAEMMKLINAAFDALKDHVGELEANETTPDTDVPNVLNDALAAIIGLAGLDIEICGLWIWVGGNTREHKEALKAAGYKFSGKKVRWYFRPLEQAFKHRGGKEWSMDEIRQWHGSSKPAWARRSSLPNDTGAAA